MPKAKMVKAGLLPIHKLIEEDIDSQASALELILTLKQKFAKVDREKDQLKRYLKERDPSAYHWLCRIDQEERSIIDEVIRLAEHIREINHQSNTLLKTFDVERKHKR
ncbi:MAG: hypothetical protein H5T94_04805 [Pseudothermotoga sp.]|nr:hypothetical protein [Pseudothermotoga sp.]